MGKWTVCVFWVFCYNARNILGLGLLHDMGMNLLSGSRNESRPCLILLIMPLYILHLLSLTFYIIKYVVYMCKVTTQWLPQNIAGVRQRSKNTEVTQTIRIIMVGIGSIKQLGKNI